MKRCLAALLLGSAALAGAETWRFAMIGDTPYSDSERRELPRMLDAIAESHVDFVVHIGDIKNGQSRCDDAVFKDRLQLFDSNPAPFIFVPGDNEWTDCGRLSNGAYDPLERLAALRKIFWQKPDSLGRKRIALERQPGTYSEHSRFRLGPALFVTLNLPGDDHNYGLRSEPRREFLERNPVVLAWLKESFALARREKLAGIVLLFQANPGFARFSEGLPHRGFRDFLETLRQETLGFSGQVVAVHGDSHISRIDQPLRDDNGKKIPNFTRVETFGYPLMGWTRGIVDTDSPTLFRFETYPWPPKAQ
ncbi:MAG: metallophosphoesterase [Dechloromonas sp.]|nr:metallophosphoesterase [Dechloromonas sp.]